MNAKLELDLVGAYVDLLDMADEIDKEGGYASFEIKARMFDLCCKVEQTRHLGRIADLLEHVTIIAETPLDE